MRVWLLLLALFTATGSCDEEPEESKKCQQTRKSMEFRGWSTDGLSFEESGPLILILRGEKLLGYRVYESDWERRAPEPIDLDGITRIVYSDGHEKGQFHFSMDDPKEITAWIHAYKNHMEYERKFVRFVPISPDAPFKELREEIQFGGSCLCSLGLRFYQGEVEKLFLKGHLHEHPQVDGIGARNEILHALVANRERIESRKRQRAIPIEDAFDPFAEPKTE